MLAAPPETLAIRFAVTVAVAFGVVWVAYKAQQDPRTFVIVGLNGLTLAGLYFVVASGFTLIFGLMRVVNMAHGSLYMLAGFFAFEVQERMTGGDAVSAFGSSQAGFGDWIVPLVVASLAVGVLGLLMQQLFLRWNQGQELRQALITIALSVIIADQVIAHFHEGIAVTITWPGWTNRLVDLQIFDLQYSLARLGLFGIGVIVGVLLWLWLYRTRMGMVIRAGVDDQHMTSALGVNIQLVFAIGFVVGSALAAFGGAVGGSQGGIASGQDGLWLLNSLIVVIIGGMGSLVGAAAGSLLYGLVFSFSAVYLPQGSTEYAIVLTFVLLALVLAFRPHGLFGRAG